MKSQTIYTSSEADRARVLAFFERVPLDKPLVWTVEDKPTARSLQQNRLYWKWLGIIASDTGNSVDGLHEVFKQKFLAPVIVELGGEISKVYTTKKLKVGEMSEYMKQVEAQAAEFGIYLPIPEEMHRREN